MRGREESRPALVLAVLVGAILALSPAGAGGAGPKRQAGALRARQATLAARSHAALLGLYSVDTRLGRVRAELASLRDRSEAVRRERMQVAHDRAIAERALQASQELLGAHLRTLYEEGEPNTLAVLLGATSVGDAANRLDTLERSATMSERAVTQTRGARRSLTRLSRELAARAAELEGLRARAEATASSLAAARADRLAYVASLTRERRLTTAQIASLDASARQSVAQTQTIEATRVAAPTGSPSAAPPAADGTRTITVTSTGYALTGSTATGIPVGPGVVAVDPTVIPLGTRMTIPGYGEGVAADTGGAVQGYTIDLWFPTIAQALAWGRRTVTITLH